MRDVGCGARLPSMAVVLRRHTGGVSLLLRRVPLIRSGRGPGAKNKSLRAEAKRKAIREAFAHLEDEKNILAKETADEDEALATELEKLAVVTSPKRSRS